ncbi:MAG: hypothetical protein ACREQO_14775 [Candidatus Binatia bacterium]
MKTSRRELFRFASTGAAMPVLLGFFLLVFSPALAQDVAKARRQNQDHVKQCTERFAYNPENTASLGPHDLGAGEREWRECVYEGVEKYLILNTATPEAYRKAIAEDRELTAKVEASKMTRAQRRARVEKIIGELEALEKKNKVKLEQQIKTTTGLMKTEIQRQQDLMRMQDTRSMMRSLAR